MLRLLHACNLLLVTNAVILAAPQGKTPPVEKPAPVATIWVSHEFIGGPKCVSSGPVIHYTAPGFETEKARFRQAKITVTREFYRDLATCQACHSCPNYHREILFEIKETDLPLSEKLGYRKTKNPPDTEELKEYEDTKRYKPKPDVPPEE